MDIEMAFEKKLSKSATHAMDVASKDFSPNIWYLISILATLPVSIVS